MRSHGCHRTSQCIDNSLGLEWISYCTDNVQTAQAEKARGASNQTNTVLHVEQRAAFIVCTRPMDVSKPCTVCKSEPSAALCTAVHKRCRLLRTPAGRQGKANNYHRSNKGGHQASKVFDDNKNNKRETHRIGILELVLFKKRKHTGGGSLREPLGKPL